MSVPIQTQAGMSYKGATYAPLLSKKLSLSGGTTYSVQNTEYVSRINQRSSRGEAHP